jgi:hypothetical protein
MAEGHSDDNHVEVTVVTTSGRYPASGTDRNSVNQPVENVLKKAANELHIVSTTNWVARIGGRELDVSKSYVDNGLSGTITIDYGPREGGGGA